MTEITRKSILAEAERCVCGEPWTLFDGTPQENNMHYCPNCGAKMEDKT